MVNVYVWEPFALLEALEERTFPDLGHVSLEITDSAQHPLAYISFWPEKDTLIGVAMQPFWHRKTRHPGSYTIEIDPEGGFMRRPADYVETLLGLREARMLADWQELADDGYDAAEWNCGSLVKHLLLRAMSPEDRQRTAEMLHRTANDLNPFGNDGGFVNLLRQLAEASLIDASPEDILELARAYRLQWVRQQQAAQVAIAPGQKAEFVPVERQQK
ncbi:MAG: hypothetical protein OHK0029_21960 [Armatimonadaceae bacterium]